MKKRLLLFAILFIIYNGKAQNLVINEFMQSNIDCIMDDLNEFPDSWVELYNPTDNSINLLDYKIACKKIVNEAWQLPDTTVAAHGYVIIYCDKAGKNAGVSAMHTDFSLETGKNGTLFLFKDSVLADSLEAIAKQPAPNIAYGRKTDGADTWGYQAIPTPGASNCGEVCKTVLAEPIFGTPGQVITSGGSISLTLTLPDGAPEGALIRYTTDGSEPLQTSTLYNDAIDISQNTVVRAKLFCDGYLSPRSTCHSYLFFPNNRELTLSVISLTTDDRYLNDEKIGILVEGNYSTEQKNYEYDWRRPVNVEFFEKDGECCVINQLCETRIGGVASRMWPRKSMILYANKRFGAKRLDYEFFPDQRPGVHEFKSIMLRNAGNDFHFLFMRDAIVQRTMASHVDIDWQAWRPVIIYINGEYRGMLNIRERSNDDNIYTNYNGLEDIDMIENFTELKEGTLDNYKAFVTFYRQRGHNYAEYAQWMDIQEFINVMIGNLYFCNIDFPGNNNVLWRPTEVDGKWRWFLKDIDLGLGQRKTADFNMIAWFYDNSYDSYYNWSNRPGHTVLFRNLMENDDFKREFLDKAAIYMGDFLNLKGVSEVWDPMYQLIQTEYPYHRALIDPTWPNYQNEMEKVRLWLSERAAYFYDHLAEFYNWGTPTPLTINTTDSLDIVLTVNGIQLSGNVFDGKYYAGRTITVNAQSNDEELVVTGWLLTGAITQEIQGSELTIAMPDDSLAITPILTTEDIHSDIPSIKYTEDHTIYDLMGNKVNTPVSGNVYIQNRKKILFW